MLSEVAAPNKSVDTKSQRGGVRRGWRSACANGLTLSEWVRDVLLWALADGGPEANEIVPAELLALRSRCF